MAGLATESRTQPRPRHPSPDSSETLDVLLVEGNAELSELYRIKLELDGYRVTVVETNTVLQRSAERRPDIIYLLGRAPDEVTRLLAALRDTPATAAIPTVIVSAWTREELERTGFELGALDYLIRFDASPIALGVDPTAE